MTSLDEDVDWTAAFRLFQNSTQVISAEWGVPIVFIIDQAQFQGLAMQNRQKFGGRVVITLYNLVSCLKLHFHIKPEHQNFIRFLDVTNMKIQTKSDFPLFDIAPEKIGDALAVSALAVNKIILQTGKPEVLNLPDLGLSEDFSNIVAEIDRVKDGLQHYVFFDRELSQFFTKQQFDQLKAQIESPDQIVETQTKVFFQTEALIQAFETVLKRRFDIHRWKTNQIFCENKHVEYNRDKLRRHRESIQQEFALTIEDKRKRFAQFKKDIENLEKLVLVQPDGAEETKQSRMTARQLTEHFDCEVFKKKGEQIMKNYTGLHAKLDNYLTQFKEIEPSEHGPISSFKDEKKKLDNLVAWFQEEKKRLRGACQQMIEGSMEQPDLRQISEHIEVNKVEITGAWHYIKGRREDIYQTRKRFFEKRTKLMAKQDRLKELLKQQEQDTYILMIPGKFPQAFQSAIDELSRRKAVSRATLKVCHLLQRSMSSELEVRQEFNRQYSDYLPISIQNDLERQPMDILFNEQQAEASTNYKLIESLEVSDQIILEKIQHMMERVFKYFKDTVQKEFSTIGKGDDGAIQEVYEELGVVKEQLRVANSQAQASLQAAKQAESQLRDAEASAISKGRMAEEAQKKLDIAVNEIKSLRTTSEQQKATTTELQASTKIFAEKATELEEFNLRLNMQLQELKENNQELMTTLEDEKQDFLERTEEMSDAFRNKQQEVVECHSKITTYQQELEELRIQLTYAQEQEHEAKLNLERIKEGARVRLEQSSHDVSSLDSTTKSLEEVLRMKDQEIEEMRKDFKTKMDDQTWVFEQQLEEFKKNSNNEIASLQSVNKELRETAQNPSKNIQRIRELEHLLADEQEQVTRLQKQLLSKEKSGSFAISSSSKQASKIADLEFENNELKKDMRNLTEQVRSLKKELDGSQAKQVAELSDLRESLSLKNAQLDGLGSIKQEAIVALENQVKDLTAQVEHHKVRAENLEQQAVALQELIQRQAVQIQQKDAQITSSANEIQMSRQNFSLFKEEIARLRNRNQELVNQSQDMSNSSIQSTGTVDRQATEKQIFQELMGPLSHLGLPVDFNSIGQSKVPVKMLISRLAEVIQTQIAMRDAIKDALVMHAQEIDCSGNWGADDVEGILDDIIHHQTPVEQFVRSQTGLLEGPIDNEVLQDYGLCKLYGQPREGCCVMMFFSSQHQQYFFCSKDDSGTTCFYYITDTHSTSDQERLEEELDSYARDHEQPTGKPKVIMIEVTGVGEPKQTFHQVYRKLEYSEIKFISFIN